MEYYNIDAGDDVTIISIRRVDQAVRIGTGATFCEARENFESTPVQGGGHSPLTRALAWARGMWADFAPGEFEPLEQGVLREEN